MTILFLAWIGPAVADPVYPECDPTRGNEPCVIQAEGELPPPTEEGVPEIFEPANLPEPETPWGSLEWLLPAGSEPLGEPRAARPLPVYDTWAFRPHPTSEERVRANPLKGLDVTTPSTIDVFTGPAPIPLPPYP